MDVSRQIFNSQHSTTDLVDLFGKRYKIDEIDQTFRWLCLNEVSNYLTFKRICELAKQCCYYKWKWVWYKGWYKRQQKFSKWN